MGKSSLSWLTAFGVACMLCSPSVGFAQEDEYVDYSDTEAAGEADWSVSYGDGADAEVGAESEDDRSLMNWEGSEEESSEDDAEPREEGDEPKPWEWGAKRHHSTLTGTTGLLHMQEAGSGPAGTFGIGVHGTWFKYDDYLIKGDENTGMWGNVNIRITPLEFLEIHYGISASANYNNKEYPTLFQALGDMDLGIKGFFSPIDALTLGLDVSMVMLNSVGEVALDWSGTSFGFDALMSFDMREVAQDVPLRFHLKAGYFFDRAANLIEDLEAENGGCGTKDENGNVQYAGCLSPVERTALGIDRNDQFRIGVGIDAILPYVSPIVEYKMEIPVNRQDFVCPKGVDESYDSCMVEEGGGGFRQSLTIGARVIPPIEDLAIDLGVDIGLTGYAPSVHELAAEAPYRIIFGASYNFDPFPEEAPPPPPPAPVVVETPPPPPPPAKILGLVHDEASVDTPVAEARISYVGLDVNAQVTGSDGRVTSYELPAGTLTVTVGADGYEEGTFTVEIPETGDVEQNFPLKAIPKKGTVSIQVLDEEDKPLSGITVEVKGAHKGSFTSDAKGVITFETDEGKLNLSCGQEGYLAKRMTVNAKVETDTQVQMQLRAKPKKSLVVVNANRIRIKKKIHFETNSDQIDPRSFALLDEVADTLITNTEIKLVEIQGHTDDRGKRDYNIDLSERRARSVKRYLTDSGVESSRLEYKGYGPEKPVAPNVTSSGRARNRRVEFHIKERAE